MHIAPSVNGMSLLPKYYFLTYWSRIPCEKNIVVFKDFQILFGFTCYETELKVNYFFKLNFAFMNQCFKQLSEIQLLLIFVSLVVRIRSDLLSHYFLMSPF